MEKKDSSIATTPHEEEATSTHRGWKAMPYIIGNEAFEKLGTIGTGANLLVYLTSVFHMSNVSATTLLNVFNGTANMAPLLGAFLSDTYFGRYITLGFASVASLVGMCILTLTAGISKLHPPPCEQGQSCVSHTPWQLAVLLSSFFFLVIGAGGIRPCNLAFGADQFDPRTESGKKGINSFFNWYYFTLAFAFLVSSTAIIYIQSDVSWVWGFTIPAVLMFLSCAFFFVGTYAYVIVKPEGSPFTSIARVIVAAVRKRKCEASEEMKVALFDPPHLAVISSKLQHTDQFKFLDKASLITPSDHINPDNVPMNPWRLTTLQQVEEVKCVFRILPIWAASLMFNITNTQINNFMVFCALQSDRRLVGTNFRIPAASFSVFSTLSVAIWVPLYDRVIVPCLQRYTKKEGGITLLQRMGVGIFLSLVALVLFAGVEVERRSIALRGNTIGIANGGGAISAMSTMWLILPLAVLGISEAFNAIAQVEFYYKQFPENMRSIAGAFVFLSMSLSSYASGFIVTIMHKISNWLSQDLNKGRLDLFYLVIAGMGFVNFVYFVVVAKWYRYKLVDVETEREVELEANVIKS